jgi:hypothetical protein
VGYLGTGVQAVTVVRARARSDDRNTSCHGICSRRHCHNRLAASSSSRHRHGLGDLVVGGALISPLGWTYYIWWAAGPIGIVAIRFLQQQVNRRWQILAIAACFWLPLNALIIGQPSVFASFFVGSVFTWALLSLWWVSLREAQRPHPDRLSHRVAIPLTQAAAVPALPCSGNALE